MSSADRYAVIGHPVSHSRSPFIHERFAQQVGHDIQYTRIDARPEVFVDTVRAAIDERLGPLLPALEKLLAAQGLSLDEWSPPRAPNGD